MNFGEYIHSSQHAPMGCGPMATCTQCKAEGMGPVATRHARAYGPSRGSQLGAAEEVKSPYPSKEELIRYLIMFTAAQIFAEVVIKRFILKK